MYGAVFTADYPFNGIDDKGQEFQVLGASFSRFRVFVFEFWVLRFRDLGASCFGLRFRVLRFRNYRVSPLQKLLLSRTSGHGQAKQITKPIIQFSSHFTKAKSSSNAVLKRKLEES